MYRLSYVLVTPARNEERYIEKTIESVTSQTCLPTRWVIVNDGSTDRTGAIVTSYLKRYPWITLVELPQHRQRSFAGKVDAFNAGLVTLCDSDYEVVGNLDGDISFGPNYFDFLLGQFVKDASLGVAGTSFKEEGYSSSTDSFEGQTHVAGGCQLFRRRCFEDIGGYVANRAGGIDWIAVTTARMKGWKTRSFRDQYFFHYRSLGTAERGPLASTFSYGEKDYYLGGHPLWELFRVAYRMTKRPYVVGGVVLGAGYLWALIRRIRRPVSMELMQFHRREQMIKLRAIWRILLKCKRIDTFEVLSR
ncbi:MAG: glycosyltransferase family 2 protein [Bryobacterales bacterium]|nr:glycosyltransferase family 2 protein [Bryobacterales bacterium]